MRRERQVDVVAVRVVEAGADDCGLQIVVAHDARHAAEIAKRALVEPQERLELLVPDRFFVAVAGVPQRHAKHPRPTPLARRSIERGRATKEVDLSFGTGRAMKHADRSSRRRDRPHEPLHRFVAGAVAVLLDEVLPDPLQAQARVQFLGNRRAIEDGREPRARRRAGERFGRVCLRAGERFGRIWVAARRTIGRIRRG